MSAVVAKTCSGGCPANSTRRLAPFRFYSHQRHHPPIPTPKKRWLIRSKVCHATPPFLFLFSFFLLFCECVCVCVFHSLLTGRRVFIFSFTHSLQSNYSTTSLSLAGFFFMFYDLLPFFSFWICGAFRGFAQQRGAYTLKQPSPTNIRFSISPQAVRRRSLLKRITGY